MGWHPPDPKSSGPKWTTWTCLQPAHAVQSHLHCGHLCGVNCQKIATMHKARLMQMALFVKKLLMNVAKKHILNLTPCSVPSTISQVWHDASQKTLCPCSMRRQHSALNQVTLQASAQRNFKTTMEQQGHGVKKANMVSVGSSIYLTSQHVPQACVPDLPTTRLSNV